MKNLKQNLIITIIAITIASFSIYYATAGIFKINTQVINDLTSGLVGYWTFDGQDTDWGANTTNDVSTNSNTGTMTNMSTSTSPVEGIMGSALEFDGVDDYVSLPELGLFGDGVTEEGGTISVWVKLNVNDCYLNGDAYNVFNFGYGSSDYFQFSYDGGSGTTWRIRLIGGGGTLNTVYVDCESAIDLNSWTNFTTTWTTDGSIEVFKNGVSTNSNPGTMTSFNGTWDYNLGYSSVNSQFKGYMDEVRAYNRILSANEIKDLYNHGAKRLIKTNINQKTDLVGSGLVGYWTFDGQDTDWGANTTNDMSTNSNTGTMINMSTSTSHTEGIIGSALEFDGDDDYVEISPSASIDGLTSFTYSAWVKAQTDTNSVNPIIEKGSGSSIKKTLYFSADHSRKVISRVDTDTTNAYSETLADYYTVGQWEHWTSTYDDNGDRNIRIYKNGQEVSYAEQTAATGIINDDTSFKLSLGTTPGTQFYEFTGLIDEVRIYDRALSASEITELYNQGAKIVLKININQKTDLVGSGLVGYWTFDGQDTDWGANTTSDMSTNSNTGTMTNMSTSTSPIEGIIGSAMDFNGNDDYVRVASNSSLAGMSALSISAWVYYQDLNGFYGIIVDKQRTPDNGINGSYQLYKYTGNNNIGGYLHDIMNDTDTGVAFTSNEWQHVMMIYNGSNCYWYKNGQLIYTVSGLSGQINDTLAALDIGGSSNQDWDLDAIIDEVRIYDRALSISEVSELYVAGAGR